MCTNTLKCNFHINYNKLMRENSNNSLMRKTKIIATLGPSTFNKEKICELLEVGMNVVRINMSHEVEKSLLEDVINWIRNEAKNLG